MLPYFLGGGDCVVGWSKFTVLDSVNWVSSQIDSPTFMFSTKTKFNNSVDLHQKENVFNLLQSFQYLLNFHQGFWT